MLLVNNFNFIFFFFNDTATTEIYTLSLHDALPICRSARSLARPSSTRCSSTRCSLRNTRSEEHTSELQSLTNLVCRLLLEKKKKKKIHKDGVIQYVHENKSPSRTLDISRHC